MKKNYFLEGIIIAPINNPIGADIAMQYADSIISKSLFFLTMKSERMK
jgi:hypothetical protein